MAQQMSVKLSRSDASPWGFRLQGGKDFGSPLLIQKVNGGSPAERAGLQAGDAVIKVNNVEVFNLRHKEAQDHIVRAGNGFEITVQRGGSTWKPAITPVGPSPVIPQSGTHIIPVTKTSLAANKPAAAPIGATHNYSPAPFGQQQMNGSAMDPVKSIVNKQYNTPVGMYSEETIAETLSAQAEVLAGGVLGVNFKKNERNYDPKNSEVFKMLNEIANEPRTPEPEVNAPCYDRPAPAPAPSAVPFSVSGLRRVTAPETRPADEQKTVLPPGQNICAECERLVVGVFVRIKDKNLHVECFKCATCGTSLKNVGYYNINNKLYCDVHAKLVARQHPPAPNLEPVTIPPGAQKPAGAISAALASRGAPAPPQPSNFAPMPFHSPGGFAGVKPSFNAAPPKQPSAPAPAPAPAPFTTPAKPAPVSGKFVWPPKNQPDEDPTSQSTATPLYIPPVPIAPSAPVLSQPSDANPPARKSSLKCQPSAPAAPRIQPFPQPYSEFASQHPVARPMSAYRYSPKPLGSTEARPRSAFAEPSHIPREPPGLPATSHAVTFDEQVQFLDSEVIMSTNFEETSSSSHHKKYSVCSQEVLGITDGQELPASLEQLSESIDTAMLVSKLAGRPESPVPMEHVQEVSESQSEEPRTETEEPSTSATSQPVAQAKRSSIGQMPSSAAPAGWQSPLVCALTTAPERPYSPFPTTPVVQEDEAPQTVSPRPTALPVAYRQLPQPEEGFIPIADPTSSELISALTIAPERPYSPLPPPMAPLPAKPVPLPEPTQPYHSSREQCASPMLSALIVAPDRPYSPLCVTQAPTTSFVDTVQDTQLSVTFSQQPFNLPTPSAYSSMLSALTIAPDRPYSPLCVTQAPTLTADSSSTDTLPLAPAKPVPTKIVGDVQPTVFKPAPAPEVVETPAQAPPNPSVPVLKEVIPPIEPSPADVPVVQVAETEAKPAVQEPPKKPKPQQTQKTQKVVAEKTTSKQQKVVKVESQKTSNMESSTNALNLHRQTQQRPITPKVPPRAVTPSKSTGLQKPATIPYYQQSIADGDFPCRSPRPGTPGLICPMTVPRTPTPGVAAAGRPVTPIPHKQLNVVRSLTPVQRVPQKQQAQANTCTQQVSQKQQGQTNTFAQKGQQVSQKQQVQSNICTQQLSQKQQVQTNTFAQKGQQVSQRQSVAQPVQANICTQQGPQVVVTRKTHVTEEFESFHKESTQVIEKSGTSRKCVSQSEKSSAVAQQSDLRSKEVTAITDGAVTQREATAVQSSQLAAQSQQFSYDSRSNSQIAAQSTQFMLESKQQSTTAPVQSISSQAPHNMLPVQPLPKENFMSLEESQRASPLPFPNISLPDGMTYAVVDNKALYTSGQSKQVYKLSQPHQMMAQKEPLPQFQPPAFKAPSIQKLAPKFEPAASALPQSVPVPFAPPPSSQVKFQPVAPQPPPAVTKPIQTPTATLPVSVMSNSPHASAFQPTGSHGATRFTPRSSGSNGFQSFAPPEGGAAQVTPGAAPRRASGAFQAPRPSFPPAPVPQGLASQGNAWDAIPRHVAPDPGLMRPSTSPPNAGGGSAPKGGSVAGTSAPVRGRGVLNQPGTRQAMCASCHTQIRGPFVTALGKTWCPNHFVCSNPQCTRELADIGFVEEKGQLYCEYCFEQFIAPGCSKCNKKIKGDCLNAIGKHFHPECFACSYCNKLFENNPFFLEDGMPYCQADWNELFTTKCFACGFPIEAGDRWVEALNNNYHSQCFNCTSCKKNLEGQSFFAKSGRPFCKAHAR